jgi:hypothetical protein
MKKSVACAIAQFDEAEAFVALEPFDDGIDRRSGRRRLTAAATTTEAAAARCATESGTRWAAAAGPRRIEGRRTIIIEPTLPGSPEIFTFAHVLPARLRLRRSLTTQLQMQPSQIKTRNAIWMMQANKASDPRVPAIFLLLVFNVNADRPVFSLIRIQKSELWLPVFKSIRQT